MPGSLPARCCCSISGSLITPHRSCFLPPCPPPCAACGRPSDSIDVHQHTYHPSLPRRRTRARYALRPLLPPSPLSSPHLHPIRPSNTLTLVLFEYFARVLGQLVRLVLIVCGCTNLGRCHRALPRRIGYWAYGLRSLVMNDGVPMMVTLYDVE